MTIEIKRKILGPSLEKLVEPIFAETKVVSFTRPQLTTFCLTIEDVNEVHFDTEAAGEEGFYRELKKESGEIEKISDTPLAGTQTAAFGENFIRERVAQLIKTFEKDMKIISWKIRFPNPVFPDQPIEYRANPFLDKSEIRGISTSGKVNGKEVVSMEATLDENFNAFKGIEEEALLSRPYAFDARKQERFCKSSSIKVSSQMPSMLVVGYITSGLIELLRVSTLEKKASNIRMTFKNFVEPQIDLPITIRVYAPSKSSERKGKFLYDMRAIALQENRYLMYGEILCGRTKKTDFKRIF